MGDAPTYSDDGRQGLGPDCTRLQSEGFYDALQEEDDANGNTPDEGHFDSTGDFKDCVTDFKDRVALSVTQDYVSAADTDLDYVIDRLVNETHHVSSTGSKVTWTDFTSLRCLRNRTCRACCCERWEPLKAEKEPPKCEKIRPMTALLRADIIKKSFAMTRQCVRLPMGSTLRKMLKSANPALNVPRRAEDVAAAFLYADTPTVDSGEKIATIFVGTSSGVQAICRHVGGRCP